MATATARNAMATPHHSIDLNDGAATNKSIIPSGNERFLDPEQAAVFLGGLNSRTVTRWAREGYLPAYPIGEGKRRLWRFLESDLEQWMHSRRTGQLSSDPEAPERTLRTAADAPIGGRFQ